MQLEELSQSTADIKGVGPQLYKQLSAIGLGRVRDLLWHLPRSYEDRSVKTTFAEARERLAGRGGELGFDGLPGQESSVSVNTVAKVIAHDWIGNGPKKFLKIRLTDGTANGSLLCFNRDFLARSLVPGTEISLAGRAELKFGEIQLSAFEYRSGPAPDFERILPVYPLSAGLNQAQFRKIMPQALATWGIGISECLPPDIIRRYGFPARKEAFHWIHLPDSQEEIARARARFVYEELFFLQLQLGLTRRARAGNVPPRPASASATASLGPLTRRFLDSLGFQLTSGQSASLEDIVADLAKEAPMSRLVQGDVGCGKTVVALAAALEVIARGRQVALMVPTVLLARQHAERAAALLEPLGVRVALVAGTMNRGTRSPLMEALESGSIDLAIGTHGLFSEKISYRNLGLAIIDEQHRFGVRQRQALYHKADRPHLLMMTATPIPQTLALTLFGDMDVSVIQTLPQGRRPVETHLARMGNEEKVYAWVERELAKGHQAYFVYPVIEEGGVLELKSAQEMAEVLAGRYGTDKVALLHSKVDEEQKSNIMQHFARGDIAVLVATSVVEVGVDVANATCMVIEHAERFGMAALHQLRGRVGRGSAQSYCFLVYGEPLSTEGKERLRAMKEHHDGFVLAERDLEIRGPGDLAGVEQSGYLRLRAADLVRDAAIMVQARADVEALLAADPELASPELAGLRASLALPRHEEES